MIKKLITALTAVFTVVMIIVTTSVGSFGLSADNLQIWATTFGVTDISIYDAGITINDDTYIYPKIKTLQGLPIYFINTWLRFNSSYQATAGYIECCDILPVNIGYHKTLYIGTDKYDIVFDYPDNSAYLGSSIETQVMSMILHAQQYSRPIYAVFKNDMLLTKDDMSDGDIFDSGTSYCIYDFNLPAECQKAIIFATLVEHEGEYYIELHFSYATDVDTYSGNFAHRGTTMYALYNYNDPDTDRMFTSVYVAYIPITQTEIDSMQTIEGGTTTSEQDVLNHLECTSCGSHNLTLSLIGYDLNNGPVYQIHCRDCGNNDYWSFTDTQMAYIRELAADTTNDYNIEFGTIGTGLDTSAITGSGDIVGTLFSALGGMPQFFSDVFSGIATMFQGLYACLPAGFASAFGYVLTIMVIVALVNILRG